MDQRLQKYEIRRYVRDGRTTGYTVLLGKEIGTFRTKIEVLKYLEWAFEQPIEELEEEAAKDT